MSLRSLLPTSHGVGRKPLALGVLNDPVLGNSQFHVPSRSASLDASIILPRPSVQSVVQSTVWVTLPPLLWLTLTHSLRTQFSHHTLQKSCSTPWLRMPCGLGSCALPILVSPRLNIFLLVLRLYHSRDKEYPLLQTSAHHSALENVSRHWAWWPKPVIPALWQAETGRS